MLDLQRTAAFAPSWLLESAAKYRLSGLDVAEMHAVANRLLDLGIASQAAIDLFVQTYSIWYPYRALSEAAPLFEAVIAELRVPIRSKEEAARWFWRHRLRSIIEGLVRPGEGLRLLRQDFIYTPDYEWPSTDELPGTGDLIRCYYEYDHLTDNIGWLAGTEERMRSLESRILELAEAWHQEHTETIERPWLTSNVVALAKAIRRDSAFDRLPILADALEDAGCSSQDILNHCRSGGEHVRGCWVVDLVLGKD